MTTALAAVAGVVLGLCAGWAVWARRARTPDRPSAPGGGSPGEQDVAVTPAAGESTLGALTEAVQRIEHGVVVVDGDGVEQFRNRAAERLATARHGHTLVENCVRRLLLAARDGESHRETVELFGPPSEVFLVTAHPFHDTTGPGVLAVVEDRSAARRTETVRRDFVANISHELKTPVGALGLLAETIGEETDPEVIRRLSQRMSDEADRAARTIDDLLELSRIEFADDAEPERLHLADVVQEAVSRIGNAAEQSGIELRAHVDDDPVVEGDRRQLTSALYNLLDNAVKYSPHGGVVEVRAGRPTEDDVVHLVVEDHGMGIPRRSLDRIFERFYRVDRARSRNTGGTGLGLAIVRHVVSNHGGEVMVDSLEGRGSVFTLVLPCSASRAAGPLPSGAPVDRTPGPPAVPPPADSSPTRPSSADRRSTDAPAAGDRVR